MEIIVGLLFVFTGIMGAVSTKEKERPMKCKQEYVKQIDENVKICRKVELQ